MMLKYNLYFTLSWGKFIISYLALEQWVETCNKWPSVSWRYGGGGANMRMLLKITLLVLLITTLYTEKSRYQDTNLTQNVAQELCSNPYLNTEKTRAILPMARILFRMTSFRRLAAVPVSNHRTLKYRYPFICRFKVHLRFYPKTFIIKHNTLCLHNTMYKLHNKTTMQLQLLCHNCFNYPK
jgi:hypothetical protein